MNKWDKRFMEMAGFVAKALAMATLCCCPPESSAGYLFNKPST